MKAIFLKEVGENWVKALLAALVLAGVLGGMLYSGIGFPESIVSTTMMLACTLGFSAAGLGLGAMQILQDTQRGRWGFIVHRPIGRWPLFVAKVVAGLGLYLLTIAPAMAALILIARQMRIVKVPFAWEMVQPMIFAATTGVLAYAVGLMIGARRASWLGSRIFPVAVGFIAALFAGVATIHLYEAMALLLGTAALLIPAAGAYFVHNGEYEPQRLWSKPLQFLIVGAGAGCALTLSVGLVLGIIDGAMPSQPQFSYQYHVLGPDGEPVVASFTSGQHVEYFDISGRKLDVDPRRFHTLSGSGQVLHDWSGPDAPYFMRRFFHAFVVPQRYLTLLNGDRQGGNWFYVAARRRIEGIGIPGEYLGAIGPDGFAPPGATPSAFSAPLLPQQGGRRTEFMPLATTDGAYIVDFDRREIERVFTTGPDDQLISASPFVETDPAEKSGPDVETERRLVDTVLATKSRVIVIRNGGAIMETPLLHTGENWMLIVGRIAGGDFHLLYTNQQTNGQTSEAEYARLDPHGRVVSRRTLPGLAVTFPQQPEYRNLPILFVPPPVAIAAMVSRNVAGATPSRAWWLVVVAVIAATLGAILLLCRRYGFTRRHTVIWMIVAAAAGVTALWTFWVLHSRPHRVTCPGCGTLRPVDRTMCPRCGAPFAQPAAPAMEVFDSTSVSA